MVQGPLKLWTQTHNTPIPLNHPKALKLQIDMRQVLVEDGAEVKAGAPLVVLEAMKMEHAVRSLGAGLQNDRNDSRVLGMQAWLSRQVLAWCCIGSAAVGSTLGKRLHLESHAAASCGTCLQVLSWHCRPGRV